MLRRAERWCCPTQLAWLTDWTERSAVTPVCPLTGRLTRPDGLSSGLNITSLHSSVIHHSNEQSNVFLTSRTSISPDPPGTNTSSSPDLRCPAGGSRELSLCSVKGGGRDPPSPPRRFTETKTMQCVKVQESSARRLLCLRKYIGSYFTLTLLMKPQPQDLGTL